MRVLILSDIHANLAALEAVLADAAPTGFDAVWCLGDTIGYGPEPNECAERIRRLASVAVVGNHDWAVLGRMDVDSFNPEAGRAVMWTRRQLSDDNLAWLGQLPSEPQVRGDFTLTHGSPRDPVWEYLIHAPVASANLAHFDTPYCLVGHTHVPALHFIRGSGDKLEIRTPRLGLEVKLDELQRAILNPGSVGQPRDSDPRAAYALLDTERRVWQQRRVAYPIEITQAHMRAAGLPDRLIGRLEFGW
jgi:predicted phosphodiesterase